MEEARKLGWRELDVILVTGDAYVDHSSFGAAIIGRVLESKGYRVGIISQPDWRTGEDFKKLGKPRLFFGVTAGNMDSMVANYTSFKNPRRSDAYSPGEKPGLRPDRATIVYSNKIREIYNDVAIVLGGIEASLRRLAHYDYWSDRVRQSILADSPADMLVYGMGEKQVVEIAERLGKGEKISEITDIRGTMIKSQAIDSLSNFVELPSFEEVAASKESYARSFKTILEEQDPVYGRTLAQKHPKTYVVQNPPPQPLTGEELDAIYELPYMRSAHPSCEKLGGVPAIKTVQFSLVTHRGCFGSCSFCAITQHQGRIIQSRSKDSIIREARLLTQHPDFRGTIQDVGGATANMYMLGCEKQKLRGSCRTKLCVHPAICKNLKKSHRELVDLLRALRSLPRVKHVFIGSGVRYDLALCDEEYLEEICRHHVSGQLKIAPEHISREVTDAIKKPARETFEEFRKRFEELNKKLGKKQYLVPYFMSSHPGCKTEHMIELAEYIRDVGYFVEQVQDFTPTPMTASTCMFHTCLDPFTMKPVYTARTLHEKKMQRALMQFKSPKNYNLVREALEKAGRKDLIGSGRKCLIPERKPGIKARIK